MKAPCRLLFRTLAACAVMGWLQSAQAQGNNGLLLPFPAEAAVDASNGHAEQGVPGRSEPELSVRKQEDTRRALELAETFIRRQQMETAHSIPRRGEASVRVPSRAPASPAVVAARTTDPPRLESSRPGPVSELLPLPGDDSIGPPETSVLPDAPAMLQAADDTPNTPAEASVPRTDIAPAPAYGSVEDQDRRGPVFRVSGEQAFAVARARGFKFTPAGGIGSRDGMHTAASQFPNLLTSEVHGIRMTQLRPPPAWLVTETSNTFFMFCDANYNAVRLAPGWRIRGIKLDGPNWRWVACPRSGANTASFSVRVHAYKGAEIATSVALSLLTLEGPEGAVDWRDAFPWINGKGPVKQAAPSHSAPPPSAREPAGGTVTATPARGGEPELPQ